MCIRDRVKYILDVRDFSDSPDAALFVKDINVILNDPEVKVVVEKMCIRDRAYSTARLFTSPPIALLFIT